MRGRSPVAIDAAIMVRKGDDLAAPQTSALGMVTSQVLASSYGRGFPVRDSRFERKSV